MAYTATALLHKCDSELAYQGDPETGKPKDNFANESAISIHKHHIWDIKKVKVLIANQSQSITFFCGGARNYSKFIDLFDGIFILEIDLDTLNSRLDERIARDSTEWGAKEPERELLCDYIKRKKTHLMA